MQVTAICLIAWGAWMAAPVCRLLLRSAENKLDIATNRDEILIVADELLVELPEDKVRNLEFRLDEFGKRAGGEEVGRECGGRTVHTLSLIHI